MMKNRKGRSKHDESEACEEQTTKAQARKGMSPCHRTTPHPRSRLSRGSSAWRHKPGRFSRPALGWGHDACPPRGTALVRRAYLGGDRATGRGRVVLCWVESEVTCWDERRHVHIWVCDTGQRLGEPNEFSGERGCMGARRKVHSVCSVYERESALRLQAVLAGYT